MDKRDWRPAADKTMLEARAELLGLIRDFFRWRDVLEVDTPILSSSAGSDPNLVPVAAALDVQGGSGNDWYLQTSPEFAMKRLLAAGSGPVYQLAKCFRDGEAGSRHNPEFTMLEWYRPNFRMPALMEEVEALVSAVLDCGKAVRMTYAELFERYLSLDPFTASLKDLQALAREKIEVDLNSDNRDHWLDLLFSHCIEPGLIDPVFVSHYPPSQAALAELGKDNRGREAALRFELVVGGMELANGYQELTDAGEQRARFERENALRREWGLPVYPTDELFLSALEHGMPDCAGVALGVDRLLMLKTGRKDIREVIGFPAGRV